MRFRRPAENPRSGNTAGISRPDIYTLKPAARPEWLREWISNKARYCLLSCGHKEDMNNERTFISVTGTHAAVNVIITAFGKRHVDVFCERCMGFVSVQKTITLLEYLGITAKEETTEPLF